MSDNKKWFKVWASILVDPHHSNMSLQEVGRWTRLGALMVSQGNNGRMQIIPPAKPLLVLMECATFETLILALKALPNVHIEECENDNGAFTVSFSKWFKYQMDFTAYERVKRSRYKRRGEKIRSTSTSILTPPATRAASLLASPPLAGRAVKSFEEAADNELCGPPKNMWAEVEKKK